MKLIIEKIEKYLVESAKPKIPGYKTQKACENCAHFMSFYGEDPVCQNPEYSENFNFDVYGKDEAGINLELTISGVCPKYKKESRW